MVRHTLCMSHGAAKSKICCSATFSLFFGASPRCAIESFSHSLKAKGKGLIAGWMGKLNKCSEIMRNWERLLNKKRERCRPDFFLQCWSRSVRVDGVGMEKETHRFVCQAGRSNVGRCEAADLRAGAYSVKKWLTLLGNFELVMVQSR